MKRFKHLIISGFLVVFLSGCLESSREKSFIGVKKQPATNQNRTNWPRMPDIDLSHERLRPDVTLVSNFLLYANSEEVDPEIRNIDTTAIALSQLAFIGQKNKKLSGQRTFPTPTLFTGGLSAEISPDGYQHAENFFRTNFGTGPNQNPGLFLLGSLGGDDDFNLFCNHFWREVSNCPVDAYYYGYIKHFEVDLLLQTLYFRFQTVRDTGSNTEGFTLPESQINHFEATLNTFRQFLGEGNFSIIVNSHNDIFAANFNAASRTRMEALFNEFHEIKLYTYSGEVFEKQCLTRTAGKPTYHKVGVPPLVHVRSGNPSGFRGYIDLNINHDHYELRVMELDATASTPINVQRELYRMSLSQISCD